MENKRFTRRTFVKGAAIGGALALGGGGLLKISSGGVTATTEEIPRLLPTVCEMCSARCGVVAYVRGKTLYKLEGNFRHSHSLGRICGRGVAGLKLAEDPDRLKSPLKRGTDGKYQEISWEVAYREIAEKLQQIRQKDGAQSLVWMRDIGLTDLWDRQFMGAFGSPNLFSDITVSHASGNLASKVTVGNVPLSDIRNSRYIMLFGRNYAESIFVSDLQALMEAKEKGAKIVVVDPRLTNTAASAHEWLPIRPGTDGALLLAMMSVIVKEGLYDKEFVSLHTVGFDKLKTYLSETGPAWAESITDIPVEDIVRIAREFASAKPACGVDPGWHGGWGALYANSVQTARAALSLNALMGNYGAKGGMVFPTLAKVGRFDPPPTPMVNVPRIDEVDANKYPELADGNGVVQKLTEIIQSERPYPVRAMFVNHLNPAHSFPNAGKMSEALGKLQLLVVCDSQMTETAQMAHYLLPASTYLEREDPIAVSRRFDMEVALRQPVIETLHDTKPVHQIITELATTMGFKDYFNFKLDDVNRAILAPLGVSLEEVRAQGLWRGKPVDQPFNLQFSTPSGKIEFYSERLRASGFEPLPVYQPPMVKPQGASAFRLIHGRESLHTGSATQNNAWLHELRKENALWINAVRAARLGISDGDAVQVESEVATVKAKARVTEGIHPDAVFLALGYGHTVEAQHRSFGKGVNVHELLVNRVEPISASAALAETIVQVKRVKA